MGLEEKNQPSLTALDTCVLLDLADHYRLAWDKIKVLKTRKKSQLVVLPTVIVELMGHVDGWVPEKQRLSFEALKSMRSWDIQPINFIGTGHGINEQIARTIIREGIVPEDQWHDACLLAEASLAGCNLLISNDKHLKNADNYKLRKVFEKHDVMVVATNGY